MGFWGHGQPGDFIGNQKFLLYEWLSARTMQDFP